ncbi:MAG: PEP-utilizing enzyme [bacterium]
MKDLYSIKNIQKIKWGILEENRPISLYPVIYPGWSDIIKNTGKILGKPQKNIACLHHKDLGYIFVDHKEWTALGRYVLKKIIIRPAWGLSLEKNILGYSDRLVNFTAKKIFCVNLKKKTNTQLYRLYEEYIRRHSELYNQAIIHVYLDLYKPHLTTYLIEYLNRQIKKTAYKSTAKEVFTQITVPKRLSKVQHEEIALLKIASRIRAGRRSQKFEREKLSSSIIRSVGQHISKYKYLGFNFEGPPFPDQYFWKRLKELALDSVSPEEKYAAVINKKKQDRKIQEYFNNELKVDYKHQQLFSITRGIIFTKDYRKMSLVQSYYETEKLLIEIGRRVNLNIHEVRECLLHELKNMLINSQARPSDIKKRMRGCLFVIIDRRFPGKIYTDQRYRTMKKYLLKKEDLTEVNYFHGQAAYFGKTEGVIRVINTVKDLSKMKMGDILVSQMTNPDLVPAIKKAAAIITDIGGVTCHAAIISRELKIPCVIGTKIATKVLKDGDRVIVDANQGDVRRI